jgi:hypothetical protein
VILSQHNPIRMLATNVPEIHFNVILLHLHGRTSGSFSHRNCAHFRDLRFSERWLYRLLVSGMWRHVPAFQRNILQTSVLKLVMFLQTLTTTNQTIRCQKTAVSKRHIVRIYLPNNSLHAKQAVWLCGEEYKSCICSLPFHATRAAHLNSTDYLVNTTGELKRLSSTYLFLLSTFSEQTVRSKEPHITILHVGPSILSTPDSSMT